MHAVSDHKVPVIFGRLFALLVCTLIIVNTSLDIYIYVCQIIILYSFVERDNFFIFSYFSIRAGNWKECCIFEPTQEMLLR